MRWLGSMVVGCAAALFACGGGAGASGDKSGDTSGDKSASGGGSAAGAAKGAKPAPENAFSLKRVSAGVGEVRSAMAKGEDTTYKCAALEAYSEDLEKDPDPGVKKAVAELAQVCGYEAPLAVVEANIAAMEKQRKADPDKSFIGECAKAEVAMDDLTKSHASDAKVVSAKKRLTKLCGD